MRGPMERSGSMERRGEKRSGARVRENVARGERRVVATSKVSLFDVGRQTERGFKSQFHFVTFVKVKNIMPLFILHSVLVFFSWSLCEFFVLDVRVRKQDQSPTTRRKAQPSVQMNESTNTHTPKDIHSIVFCELNPPPRDHKFYFNKAFRCQPCHKFRLGEMQKNAKYNSVEKKHYPRVLLMAELSIVIL